LLEANADILESRDRKAKKLVFKAVHSGDFDGLTAQPASVYPYILPLVLLLINAPFQGAKEIRIRIFHQSYATYGSATA
jgi:hypothetical protein